DLSKNQYTTQMDLVPEELGYPRTVCTSKDCVKVCAIGPGRKIKKINYVKRCHVRCYLNGVECNVVNNSALSGCTAMNEEGNCDKCSCNWSKHMHVTYENKTKITKVIDENVKKQIEEKKSYQEIKKTAIDNKRKRINELETEQKKITSISAKFAQFLKQ